MMNTEKLNKLLTMVVNERPLITKKLKEEGNFNAKNIHAFVEEGYLRRTKLGHYVFCNAEALVAKGIELTFNNELQLAEQYFKKAYETNQKNSSVVFSYFLFCLFTQKYDIALSLYNKLMAIDAISHGYDYNYYLYLISSIIELPYEYKVLVRNMTLKNIEIPENSEQRDYNESRKQAFLKKFGIAEGELNIVFKDCKTIPFQIFVTKELYKRARLLNDKRVKNVINERANLASLLRDKKYAEAIELLQEKEKTRTISHSERHLIIVLNDLEFIEKTRAIPKPNLTKPTSIFEAIENEDYFGALLMCKAYDLRKKVNHFENPMFLALNAICEKITEIRKEEKPLAEENESLDETIVIPEEEQFAEEIHQRLIKMQGIMLLENYNDETTKLLMNIFERYIDIMSFVIEDNGQKRIVLRYRPLMNRSGYETRNILNEAKTAYNTCDYEMCIKDCLVLIHIMYEPRYYVYSLLGLAYYKKGDLKRAIDYLVVADYLAKKENSQHDYLDLIGHLREKVNGNDEVRIDNKFFGIKDFNKINKEIMASGEDVDTACTKMGMLPETRSLIKLIYAKCFYASGDIEKGDDFFQSVFDLKIKSTKIEKLLNTVQKNRDFCQKQREYSSIPLSLSLAPKSV